MVGITLVSPLTPGADQNQRTCANPQLFVRHLETQVNSHSNKMSVENRIKRGTLN